MKNYTCSNNEVLNDVGKRPWHACWLTHALWLTWGPTVKSTEDTRRRDITAPQPMVQIELHPGWYEVVGGLMFRKRLP